MKFNFLSKDEKERLNVVLSDSFFANEKLVANPPFTINLDEDVKKEDFRRFIQLFELYSIYPISKQFDNNLDIMISKLNRKFNQLYGEDIFIKTLPELETRNFFEEMTNKEVAGYLRKYYPDLIFQEEKGEESVILRQEAKEKNESG